MYFEGCYWGFANTSNSITPASELGFVLVKSKDGIHWIQVTTNAPYMKLFGSADVGATIMLEGADTMVDGSHQRHPDVHRHRLLNAPFPQQRYD